MGRPPTSIFLGGPSPSSSKSPPVVTLNEALSICDFMHGIVTIVPIVGRDGALVESITFNRRVVGSTPTLAVT